MDKCIKLIVLVTIWSQITTGHTIDTRAEYVYDGLPVWESSVNHYPAHHIQDRDVVAASDEADWDSDRWPDFHGKQWDQGPEEWHNQGGDQNEPKSWNQGEPDNWNNQGSNSWHHHGKPNSWNNQAVPNNWNNQGNWNQGAGNTWNGQNLPNNWNNQDEPNGWNQGPSLNNEGRPNDWNNQNQPDTWNDQNGANANQNNVQRPPRVPQTNTAGANQLMITVCIKNCPVTPEYNPVCGSNNVTYGNIGRLECAKYCGVDVALKRSSPCSTSGVSTNSPIKDIETTTYTRFTSIEVPTPTSRPDPVRPDLNPDFTISPDIINSIFTTTEDNADIDIRTRSRFGIPQQVYPVKR